jgi:hypothetical protein
MPSLRRLNDKPALQGDGPLCRPSEVFGEFVIYGCCEVLASILQRTMNSVHYLQAPVVTMCNAKYTLPICELLKVRPPLDLALLSFGDCFRC